MVASGIFEHMTGQDAHHGVSARDYASSQSAFWSPAIGAGGGRFAADADAVDDGFGIHDLLIAYLLPRRRPSIPGRTDRFLQVDGIAYFYRRSRSSAPSPLGNGLNPLAEMPIQGIRSFEA